MITEFVPLGSRGTFTLEDLRRYLGWNPWHFWGFAHSTLVPVNAKCSDLVFEYGYMNNDAAGRNHIRDRIDFVLRNLAEYLKYPVGDTWIEEIKSYPDFLVPALRPLRNAQPSSAWLTVQANYSKLISIGYRTLTAIGDIAVTYFDNDSDGIDEAFTLTTPVAAGTTAEQIVIYFSSGEIPFGEEQFSERYRVQPLKVSIAANVATIQGNSWLIGIPTNYEYTLTGEALDPTDGNNFPRTLWVGYELVEPDGTAVTNSQAYLEWESLPNWLTDYCCSSTSDDPASTGTIIARAGIRNHNAGIIYFGGAVYSATTGLFSQASWDYCSSPSRVCVRYRAGEKMTPDWKKVIADYVLAEMPKRLCACDTANKVLHDMQFDLARTDGAAGETYAQIDANHLANPFGTRRGQLKAWLHVERRLRTGFWKP